MIIIAIIEKHGGIHNIKWNICYVKTQIKIDKGWNLTCKN